MTRKSPKSFLDAKSCVESVSEVFFEVPARPDELGTLLLARDSRNHTAQYFFSSSKDARAAFAPLATVLAASAATAATAKIDAAAQEHFACPS